MRARPPGGASGRISIRAPQASEDELGEGRLPFSQLLKKVPGRLEISCKQGATNQLKIPLQNDLVPYPRWRRL